MPPPPSITAGLDVPDARPEIVHALLTDIAAWRLWSPHLASVAPDHGTVQAGQTVATRAFFSPAVTPMHVDWVRPGEGMGWRSRALGHLLVYENRVEPRPGGGTRIAFSARVDGPAAGMVTALAGPVSRLGMRRRAGGRRPARTRRRSRRTPGTAGPRPRAWPCRRPRGR